MITYAIYKLEPQTEPGTYSYIPEHPFRPDHLLIWEPSDQMVVSFVVGQAEQLVHQYPAYMCETHLEFDLLQMMARHNKLPPFENGPLTLPTVNPGMRIQIALSGPVPRVAIWGSEARS